MIVSMELGRRDLHAHRGRQPKSSGKVRAPNSKSRCQEQLRFARVLASCV